MTFKHLDLFSGIGGFAYAAKIVWGKNYKCIGFCDNNKYCQELLKRRFPNVKIWEDIKEVQYTKEECDLITGGFPCQPFSHTGKRKGSEDDRFLWEEMYRIICEFNPRWIIAENVKGLLTIEQGMVFKKMLIDLESAGYNAQSYIIPACSVNAPHRRDRVWIIANSTCKRLEGKKCKKQQRKDRRFTTQNRGQSYTWDTNWIEVATELCGISYGLPVRLDGFELSKSRHRMERLTALGNSVVPQVVIEIMRAIKQCDDKKRRRK